METLRKQNSELFKILDRIATDQHTQLLSHLLDHLASYTADDPHLLLMPNALDRMKSHAEAAIDLEMRGKTPDRIDFGGYTLVVTLKSKDPFDTLYLTRPFSNKLKITILTQQPPIFPIALWITLNQKHPGITPEGFNPEGAFVIYRGPAPNLPPNIKKPNDLITAAVLLRESLETRSLDPQTEATLRKIIPYAIENEIGKRVFPPLQVVRSGVDDILRPEAFLLRLPIVPLIITHAAGLNKTLIQVETVPSWPKMWQPEVAFAKTTDRYVTIGEGIDYDIFTLLTLIRDLAEATTAPEDIYWPV